MRQAKQGFGGTVLMIAGVGAGAALMYLFDPERGAQRRRQIASSAGDLASGAGGAANKVWQEVAHHAASVGHNLSNHASQIASAVNQTANEVSAGLDSGSAAAHDGAHRLSGHIADHARHLQSTVNDYATKLSNLAARARKYVSSAKETAGHYAGDLRDRAGAWRDQAGDWRDQAHDYFHPRRSHSILAITVTAGSIVGIGAGAIYLFDREKGERRREEIYEKISDTISQTGRFFRTTGEYVRSQWDKIVGEPAYENPDSGPSLGDNFNTEPQLADRYPAPSHASPPTQDSVEPIAADERSSAGQP
jgi:gas vesicle protein